MADKPNWDELAKDVSAVVRLIQPFLRIEKIPEAVDAARTKVAELENQASEKQAAIKKLDGAVAAKQKELDGVTARFDAAWKEKEQELTNRQAEIIAGFTKDTVEARKALDAAVKANEQRTRVMAEKEAGLQQKLTELEVNIAEKLAELTGYQEAIARILGGKQA